MAGITYKCPSCGSYLSFDPGDQKWRCDSCKSDFTEKDLLPKADVYAQQAEQEAREAAAKQAAKQAAKPRPDGAQDQPAGGQGAAQGQVMYHCPSCGSQIITDETTVATQCYYCHNPVVLQGKLTADMKPDVVLPFSISKEDAVDSFLKWVKTKRFIPKGFFSKQEMQHMTGVYYPHFVCQCEMDATYQGEGRNVTTMDSPDYIITKTDYYAFRRRADLRFRNVMRPALGSLDRKLSDGIHPFPLDEVRPFSSAYLSGFLAERRDVDAKDVEGDVQSELVGYVEPLLSDSVHYSSSSGSSQAEVTGWKTQYALLPTWVLTYTRRGDKEKRPYYYVMNGRTGAVCGKLPINHGKLMLVALSIAAALCALLCLAGYYLW